MSSSKPLCADHGREASLHAQASEEVADGMVDYDAQGRIVGLEILDASKRTEDSAALQQFSFEIPIVS